MLNQLLGTPFATGSRTAHWLDGGILLVLAIAAAWAIHAVFFGLWRRAARKTATGSDDALVARLDQPSFWGLVFFGVIAVHPALPLHAEGRHIVARIAGLAAPALVGWIVVALIGAANDIVQLHTDLTAADNLLARRRRTRSSILHRIAIFITVLVTICLMLLSLPTVRSVGVTLMASAGIAGLAVGAAAQPLLKTLIAGIQMAFTEPIRIDDVVIVNGEWGRIEDIRLTYVIVRIWDERRLVVPVTKFLEETFENWTRRTSDLIGTAFLHLDPATDVGRLRNELKRYVATDPLWDGHVVALQVTDTSADAIEVRCLVSAADASRTFDLRCNVREALLGFIRAEMPDALPRRRNEMMVQPAGSAEG